MKLLKTKEVASILKCTARNVAKLANAGKLKPVNNHKDFFLFDADEVELFNAKKSNNGNK
jgi:hypothetical protein